MINEISDLEDNPPSRIKIVSYQNKYREFFNLFILFLSIFNALLVPLDLSFEEIPVFSSSYYQIFDNLIDVLFMVDMGLMFITSYRDKFGKEIFKPKLIAKNYVRSPRFFIDLFSLLGTGIMSSWVPNFKVFKCFKIVRIIRVNQFIQRLKIEIEIKIVLKLVKITFYMFIYLHVGACIWYSVVKESVGQVDADGRSLVWYSPAESMN